MKKILLFICVFVFLKVIHGQTNVYHPFPDSNAYWTETNWFVSSGCNVLDEHTVFVSGDTIIGTNNYHKIYKSGYISASCPPPGYNYFNSYLGALRQDTLIKKVFFLPVLNTLEELLYDFNLNIGDTLPYSYNQGQQDTVFKIDSALVGNSYHKRFILKSLVDSFPQPDSSYAIIEGVGSTFGLLAPLAVFDEAGFVLNCFAHSGQFYPTNSNCIFFTTVPKATKQKHLISISPNPIITETVIKSDNNFINATLTFYNSVGQKVNQIENLYGNIILFKRDNLPNGLYLIQINEDNKILLKEKIIIAD